MFFVCRTLNLFIVEELTEDLVDGVARLPLVPELPQLLDVALRTNQSSVLPLSANQKQALPPGPSPPHAAPWRCC